MPERDWTDYYLLFLTDDYYPGGGWSDFERLFDDLEECLEHAANSGRDWYQVVDLSTLEVVYEGRPKDLLEAHNQLLSNPKED
jgi:hypothetical protein